MSIQVQQGASRPVKHNQEVREQSTQEQVGTDHRQTYHGQRQVLGDQVLGAVDPSTENQANRSTTEFTAKSESAECCSEKLASTTP